MACCWCAADTKSAGSVSAQIVLIVHGPFSSVYSLTDCINDSLENMVFTNVLFLEKLQLRCLDVTYMTR